MSVFKIHIGYCLLHIAFKVTEHPAYFPGQNIFYFINTVVVIVFCLVVLAGALAVSQLVFKANLKLAFLNIFFVKRQVTCAQRIGFFYQP
ncbi:hypothetical protein GALL_501730 [mine drainage metagenome]|uniref:Uncharacterized protein n=1 Tax=mine drainage metagenome TaxID=410659 RepID=A0A1J5PAA9_9ZZZZ